jgi:arylsulfatase A-like enzyme
VRAQPLYKKALYLLDWQARWSVPALIEPWHLVDEFPDAVRIWREEDIGAMRYITANGFRMLRNPSLNLVFIHIPVPHPPGIWDTRDKRFTLENSNYIDNLALADATLGQIRSVMEEQGNWDSSTVLISGDHPYRPALWESRRLLKGEMAAVTQSRPFPYVPFFLKLPGQHSEVDYTKAFNNVLNADLALEILKGQLKTPQEVVSWLDAQAASSLR